MSAADTNSTTILVIGSSSGAKSYNEVAHDLMDELNKQTTVVKFQIRSTSQIENMTADEIKSLVNNSDIILAEWGTQLAGNGSLEAVIRSNPTIINDKIFFVFESGPTLVKLSKINNTNVFDGVSDKDIGTWDTPGTLIGACHDGDITALSSYKEKYPNNKALHDWIDCAIYYAASGKTNLKNQFKWALKKYAELKGILWPKEWDPEPPEIASPLSMEFLYRDGQRFTKEQYFEKYPLDPNKPTVGVLSYITSAGEVAYADAFQEIIDALVARGMNVIPAVGTWSSYINLKEDEIIELARSLCQANQTVQILSVKGIGNYTDTSSILGVTSNPKALVYEIAILENGKTVKTVKISSSQPTNVYSAMIKFFTDAENVLQYESDPKRYPCKVNAIIDLLSFITGSTVSGAQVNRFFEQANVPVLRAMITSSTYRTPGQWLVSEEGFSWMAVYWQCAQPEMQGQIEPIAVGVGELGYDPETGAQWDTTVTLPDRIQKLANRAYNWAQLQLLPNKDKKIAIVYYNYPPGKQNIGASYLNVPESLLEILKRLKAEGYNVSEIPANESELLQLLIERGINVANWAPGELERLANNTNVILWPVEDYIAWFNKLDPIAKKEMIEGPVGYIEELTKAAIEYIKKGDPRVKDEMIKTLNRWTQEMISNANTYPTVGAMATELIQNISSTLTKILDDPTNTSLWSLFYEYKSQFLALNMSGLTGWGEPPGNIMTIEKDGKRYIVIPGLLFGNIFIGPEPQRGWEADISKFYHSTVVPPPHCYLAWYAWINTVFDANAQVHLGRHATYEWTPRKQYALSSFDYPDICIADKPSIYIYIMDGVGEGMQAKRRGLAVIIDHLTPPLTQTKLYGDLQELAGLITNYEKTPEGNPLREEYAKQIRETIIKLNLAADLGLDPANITDKDIDKVHDYLLSLQQTLMPYGLHTFGENWTDDEIALMVAAMLSPDSQEDPSLQRLISMMMGWDWNNLTLEEAENVNEISIQTIKDIIAGKTINEIIGNITDENLRKSLEEKLLVAQEYIKLLKESPSCEMDALIEALSGHYITPGKGGDPVKAPYALPTGKNFYAQDDNTLPTKVAWDLGKRLADMALAQLDTIPEKIAAVVWCVETARDDGTMVSFVLRLLGVQPKLNDKTWLNGGKLSYIIPTPLDQLLADLNKARNSLGLSNLTQRPRIDVIVTTSGLFRDLYPNLLAKMDIAYRVALAASYSNIIEAYPELKGELDKALDPLITGKFQQAKTLDALLKTVDLKDPINLNYIAKHWIELVNGGYDGDTAITRIFAPPVGDYGAGVNKAVEQMWTWNDRSQLADIYLRRMSHAYSNTQWGISQQKLFQDLLKGITVTYHSRSTNLYGVIDNDDYYDYYGGLSMAIEEINSGRAPTLNVVYYANPSNPEIVSLQEFMGREIRTRYFNPEWIKGQMRAGYAGARQISNKFVDYLKGWQVTTPQLVNDYVWNEITNVYIRDKYNIGVTSWLSTGQNVYSMIKITGTLLEMAHRGYWKADAATLQLVANTWASMISSYGVSCCDCSCGNIAMIQWAMGYVNPNLLSGVKTKLYGATQNSAFAPTGTPGAPGSPGQPGTPGSTGQAGPTPGYTGGPGIGSQAGSPGIEGVVAAGGAAAGATGAVTGAGQGPGASGRVYEVSKAGGMPGASSGLPVYAVAGVIVLVVLVGVGYFLAGRGKI
ncbi:MAG: cobaltochelatase subunit CobN [Methanobacteriales archaeon]